MSESLKESLKRLHMPADALCCGAKFVVVLFPKPSSDWRTGCNWELWCEDEAENYWLIGPRFSLLSRARRQEVGTLSSRSGWDPQIVTLSSQHCTHQSIHTQSPSIQSLTLFSATLGCEVGGGFRLLRQTSVTFFPTVFSAVHLSRTNLTLCFIFMFSRAVSWSPKRSAELWICEYGRTSQLEDRSFI